MAIKRNPYQKDFFLFKKETAIRRRIFTNDQCLGTHLLCNKFCPLSFGQIWDYISVGLYRFYSFGCCWFFFIVLLPLFPDLCSIQWWPFSIFIYFFAFLWQMCVEEFLLHYNNWPSTFCPLDRFRKRFKGPFINLVVINLMVHILNHRCHFLL